MVIAFRLLFVAAFIYVALTNVLAAATGPGSNQSYWGGRFADAAEMEKRLGAPAKVDLNRLSENEVNEYFATLSEAARVDDGYKLMQAVADKALANGKPETYNKAYVSALLNQANIAVFGCRLDDAGRIYKTIFDYDTAQKQDAKLLGRDLNNLGTVAYLKGAANPDIAKRKQLFELARQHCLEANLKLGESQSIDKLSVLQNLSLISLDLDDKSQFNSYRDKAEQMRHVLNPNVPAVIL